MITYAAGLFVGGVVFFIRHDDTQTVEGREDSRSGADYDIDLTGRGFKPFISANGIGKTRMQDR